MVLAVLSALYSRVGVGFIHNPLPAKKNRFQISIKNSSIRQKKSTIEPAQRCFSLQGIYSVSIMPCSSRAVLPSLS